MQTSRQTLPLARSRCRARLCALACALRNTSRLSAADTLPSHNRSGLVSAGLARLVLDTGVRRNPVHFPRLATVVRERLLEAARVRRDVGDQEAHVDGPAIERLLVIELTAPVLELAGHRLTHGARADVREIEAPLAGFGIVESQAHAFEMAGRPIGHELHQIGPAVRDAAHRARAVVLDPGLGAGQGMLQARQVRLPGADLEIEIVLPVSGGRASAPEQESEDDDAFHHDFRSSGGRCMAAELDSGPRSGSAAASSRAVPANRRVSAT